MTLSGTTKAYDFAPHVQIYTMIIFMKKTKQDILPNDIFDILGRFGREKG